MVPTGIENAADVVLQHHRHRTVLRLRVILRVGDEKNMTMPPRLLLGAVDNLTGERG